MPEDNVDDTSDSNTESGRRSRDFKEKRLEVSEDVEEVDEQVNEVLERTVPRKTEHGEKWWDVQTEYDLESGKIKTKGRLSGKVTIEYRPGHTLDLPSEVEEEVEFLNQGIGLASDKASTLDFYPSGLVLNVEIGDGIEDGSLDQRYIRDAVGLMAEIDRVVSNYDITLYRDDER